MVHPRPQRGVPSDHSVAEFQHLRALRVGVGCLFHE